MWASSQCDLLPMSPTAVWIRWEEAALPSGLRWNSWRPIDQATSFLSNTQVLKSILFHDLPRVNLLYMDIQGTRHTVHSSSDHCGFNRCVIYHQLLPVLVQDISCSGCSQLNQLQLNIEDVEYIKEPWSYCLSKFMLTFLKTTVLFVLFMNL